MPFEFATATRILFGPGKLGEAVPMIAEMGRRALLVTGVGTRCAADFEAALLRQGVSAERFAVSGEPTITMVAEATVTFGTLKSMSAVAVQSARAGTFATVAQSNAVHPNRKT